MWTSVTTSSIFTAISTAEMALFSSLSTSSYYTSASLVQEIINDVTAEVRSYVAGCNRNSLDTDTTLIPPSCVSKAKIIIVYRLMERLAGRTTDVNDARRSDYVNAISFMEAVARGARGIEIPSSPLVPSIQANTFYGASEVPLQYT